MSASMPSAVRISPWLRVDSEAQVGAEGVLTRCPRGPATNPVESREVDRCRAWIREHAVPTRTIRPRLTSYCLKHAVETSAQASGEPCYVSNGAFIVAALREGFAAQVVTADSPNVFFNMTIRKAPRTVVAPTLRPSRAQLQLILGGRTLHRGHA